MHRKSKFGVNAFLNFDDDDPLGQTAKSDTTLVYSMGVADDGFSSAVSVPSVGFYSIQTLIDFVHIVGLGVHCMLVSTQP